MENSTNAQRLKNFIFDFEKTYNNSEKIIPSIDFFGSNKNLSVDEKIILFLYIQSELYILVNSYARKDNQKKLLAEEGYRLFTLVLDKLDKVNYQNGYHFLYRGAKIAEEEYQCFDVGYTFCSNNFFSSSNELSAAQNFAQMDIDDEANTNLNPVIFKICDYQSAISIAGYEEEHSTDGYEHVFMPNTKFKIIEITQIQGVGKLFGEWLSQIEIIQIMD